MADLTISEFVVGILFKMGWLSSKLSVEHLFKKGWRHLDKPKPFVYHVIRINPGPPLEPFRDYLNGVRNEVGTQDTIYRLLFHGTRRVCALGEASGNVQLCDSPECSLCCICRSSFDIARHGTGKGSSFMRFGAGIYTTSCSSKADDYVSNTRNDLKLRVLLVSCVVVGKASEMTQRCIEMVCPPPGCHSVLGIPEEELNYEETVVYTNDAIRPLFLITYGPPPTSECCTM